MLFLNKARWALIYTLAAIGSLALAATLMPVIVSPGGGSAKSLVQGVGLLISLLGAGHAWLIAHRATGEAPIGWYARHWYVFAGLTFGLIFALLGIRAFLFEPFHAPAASMSPTVNVGDGFLVSKAAYGAAVPQRGDVIFFWSAPHHVHFVKRVVGIAGDHVQMMDGRVFLNGAKIPARPIEAYTGSCDTGFGCNVPQVEETYPGGRSVRTVDGVEDGPLDNTGIFVVPPDSYFVLGDNRDNSNDSREALGFVPRSAILGRVVYKYASHGHWVWQPVH